MRSSAHEDVDKFTGLPRKIRVMGVGITPFVDYGHAVETVSDRIEGRQQSVIVAVAPEKICRAHSNSDLRALLSTAEITICDGIGASLAARLLTSRKVTRITGVSLFNELVAESAAKGWRIFLLGASAEVNAACSAVLSRKYPKLNVVGAMDGFFADSSLVVSAINDSHADLVFVALGSPKQECWIRENRHRISASLLMGVGGTFDVVSGRVARAPGIFRRTGTEWLYRLVREPRRWSRYLIYPTFVWLLLRYRLGLLD